MSLFRRNVPTPKAEPTEAQRKAHILNYMVDRGAALLFDWLIEPPGTETLPSYQLFGIPLGCPDRAGYTKDHSRTNMQRANSLPAPQGFITRSLHCYYSRMGEMDRAIFREKYVVQLWILDKKFYEAPLITLPDQGIVFPWVTKADEISPLSQIPEEPGNFASIPRYLPSMAYFKVQLVGEPFKLSASGQGLRFLPVLNGYLDRSVQ